MTPEATVLLTGLDETASAISSVQLAGGMIPHTPGGIADPWNHIEAAMGLDVGGLHERAARAYGWLFSTQRSDGSWPAAFRGDRVVDETIDANFVAYIAVGAWHHYLSTDDAGFLHRAWPFVERALDHVLDLQRPDGTICWARDPQGRIWDGALLTSSSCIHMSLRCGIAIVEALGGERPDWELSLQLLGDALRGAPDGFERKDRFSMDWYYPALSGALSKEQGRRRIESRWDEFVIEGKGVRCVGDRPWVTSGETAELILACDAMGLRDEALTLYDWLQHLRSDDGAYWIGATWPEGTVWPREKPTWGSGAVMLAADALAHVGPASGLFRGESLPPVPLT
ncbi:MAG: hypothetical protein QOG54_2086 [Actinomycetota bacterium]|nr:hypothetical protein [Actinomycetota bacterium]